AGDLLVKVAADVPAAEGAGEGERSDLLALLAPYAGSRVTLSGPGTPVPLPVEAAAELAAAVSAALDNVRVHAGEDAHAWILVEDEPDEVTVTVRDDGPGIPEGRLADAEREGRLGVALSIRGRLRDLGGSAEWISAPGQGTEVELSVPRQGETGR
ncbi:ATP-binding protein, partial [Streptomyces sp. MCAF7]